MTDLLPCPFCGKHPKTFQYNGATQVSCSSPHYECAGSDVVAPVPMWNTRAALDEIARLKAAERAMRSRWSDHMTTAARLFEMDDEGSQQASIVESAKASEALECAELLRAALAPAAPIEILDRNQAVDLFGWRYVADLENVDE